MEKFVDILKARFGENEPILIEEIIATFPDISRQSIYKRINAAMEEGSLARYDRGIYYLPIETRIGKSIPLASQVARKKWLESDGEVFGYKTGFNLANESGVSDQVPITLEIATNKEKMRVREVKPFGGWRKIILRKPRRPVTKRNVDALRFLDLITQESIQFYDEWEMAALKELARKAGRTMIYDCSTSYPARTARKLAECERYHVFAREPH